MVLVPFGPLRWYRLVRYDGTDCSATVVPIRPLRWYRLTDTINYPDEFEELVKIIASSIGAPVNPNKLANTFKSKKNLQAITDKTISNYLSYIEDAFLVE